jgi:hypothetical protein
MSAKGIECGPQDGSPPHKPSPRRRRSSIMDFVRPEVSPEEMSEYDRAVFGLATGVRDLRSGIVDVKQFCDSFDQV